MTRPLLTLSMLACTAGLGAAPYNGPVPAGLPSYFGIGCDDHAEAPDYWKNGQACWDYSYAYLTYFFGSWETWGGGNYQFSTNEINYWHSRGQRQVFTWYYHNGSTANMSNSGVMNDHWTDLANLFMRINSNANVSAAMKVIIHFEPDLIGYWRQMSATNYNTAGMVLVGGATPPPSWGGPAWNTTNYPNTIQGWSKAIYDMRNYYAPGKVLLAHHYTHWGTGVDIMVAPSSAANCNTHVQGMVDYLNNIENGSKFDLVFIDPADRDADWWRASNSNNTRWAAPDYNDAAFGQRSWGTEGYIANEVANRMSRWSFMWQIPVGNTYFKSCNNSDGHFRDNRVQAFLPSASANGSTGTPGDAISASSTASGPGFWASHGVLGVLFGSGAYNYSPGGAGNLCHQRDMKADGTTNPGSDSLAGGPAYNTWGTRTSAHPDDDGGYLRLAAANYCSAVKFPIGAAGSPTRTPTPSPNWSPTITPTFSVTPDFISLMIYDGESAPKDLAGESGSYAYAYQGAGGPGSTADDTAIYYAGAKSWRATMLTTSGGYAGIGWQFSPLAADARTVDSSPFDTVEFYIRGAAGGELVGLRFGSASATPLESSANGVGINAYIQGGGGVTTAWKLVSMPLSLFGLGLAGGLAWKDEVGRVVFSADGGSGAPASFNYTVYIDNLQFVKRPSSPTPTASSSRTATSTASPTPTRSASPTASSTSTASPTRTTSPSPTDSATRTSTGTPSPTRTATPSATSSASPSATSSASPSLTGSPTRSVTGTATPSATPLQSSTHTPSATPFSGSPSFTPTFSPSATPTATRTPTPTSTSSASPSGTPTSAQSPTATPSRTSFAGSATSTFSSTVTPSFTPTASSSRTATSTASPTPTRSATPTATPTPTFSASVTPGAFSFTPTPSATRSATASPTSSLTPGGAGTETATPAPSSTREEGPNLIESHLPGPNPNPLLIAAKLKGRADEVVLKVYTKAMVCLGSSRLGSQVPGWCQVPLPAEMSTAPGGLYYYRLATLRGGVENLEPGIGSFMVLR